MDPEGWRRIKGANKLDDVGRCVLRSLHLWREAEAERRDVPPFKVFAPQKMLKLASDPPRRAHHPRALPFLSHPERSRYGKKIVAVGCDGALNSIEALTKVQPLKPLRFFIVAAIQASSASKAARIRSFGEGPAAFTCFSSCSKNRSERRSSAATIRSSLLLKLL